MPARRCIWALSLVAVLAAAATGCGSDSGSSETTRPTGPAGRASTVPAIAPVQRSPSARGRQPARPGPSAAGVCETASGPLATVGLAPDSPEPRCLRVRSGERLRLLNRTAAFGGAPNVVTVRFAGFSASIQPRQGVILDEPVGRYLEPGRHLLVVSGAAGPVEIELLQPTHGAEANSSSTKPSGACTAQQARRAFVSFLAAFNRGAYVTLDSLFASQPAFEWFSSNAPGRRAERAAHERATLIAYFRRRHANRDRLRLLRFHFNDSARHASGISFELRRAAADFRRGHWFEVSGKAALVCHGGSTKFIVISIGAPDIGFD